MMSLTLRTAVTVTLAAIAVRIFFAYLDPAVYVPAAALLTLCR